MPSTILTDVSDGIGTLTLNRPDKLNAWNTEMRGEIIAALGAWNSDPKVRAVIVTGAGTRAFSAGQDLGETAKIESGAGAAAWFASWKTFYESLRNLDKPSVAALNGVAAGSGFQFALLADVRVGYAGSRMGQPEINAGIPSVLGPMLMMQRLGLSRTIELALTGRIMSAEEAHATGLIHHLVTDADQVIAKAREVAALLAAKPPLAMKLTKQRFRDVTQAEFDEAFVTGGRFQAEAFQSGEPQAAQRAFLAARGGKAKS